MKTKIFSRLALATVLTAGALSLGSCDDFLDHQKPQGTLDETQVKDPSRIDNLVISAYAVYMSAEDVNSSFSMWNFDVRSDDAYKGGNGTSDGDVFHQLEISQGILTTNWNISDMWTRLYNCISRVNTALAQLEQLDSKDYALKDERVGEMKFLRAYGHFLLKRLYKNIPFVMNSNLTVEDYNNLSNTEYTNDEGWQLIINDLEDAYKVLPAKQKEVGRPSKAAAAAFLTKAYLYKAYHQDNAQSNEVTYISADDLKKVVEYSDPAIYQAGGFDLEADFHNNFRPETQYENGVESIWAIQYSMKASMVPTVSGATGCSKLSTLATWGPASVKDCCRASPQQMPALLESLHAMRASSTAPQSTLNSTRWIGSISMAGEWTLHTSARHQRAGWSACCSGGRVCFSSSQ